MDTRTHTGAHAPQTHGLAGSSLRHPSGEEAGTWRGLVVVDDEGGRATAGGGGRAQWALVRETKAPFNPPHACRAWKTCSGRLCPCSARSPLCSGPGEAAGTPGVPHPPCGQGTLQGLEHIGILGGGKGRSAPPAQPPGPSRPLPSSDGAPRSPEVPLHPGLQPKARSGPPSSRWSPSYWLRFPTRDSGPALLPGESARAAVLTTALCVLSESLTDGGVVP